MAIAEKTTFILNNEYKEQVDMLSDVQAGQLFRAILHYANDNTVCRMTDPVVQMVFSFVRQQMDKDFKKYEETCKKRAESGKKGGRPRKNDINDNDEKEKPNGFLDNQLKAKKADCDSECESDCECDSECECDTELEYCHRRRQEEGEDAQAREEAQPVDNSIFPYGANEVPTTQAELQQFEALANHLMQKHHGRKASKFDVERVFHYVYRPAYTADDVPYAAYDQTRADLLDFVFDRAAEQNRVTWKYIGGIWDNYAKRGVQSVPAAIENEYSWNRGEVA